MAVHVVADSISKLSSLRATLEPSYSVTSELLGTASDSSGESDAVVVTADLRVVENISALKNMFGKLAHARKRIFLIDEKARLFTVQAYALGATRVLVNPVSQARLLSALADRTSPEPATNDALQGSRNAAMAGATAIASMFSAVLANEPIDLDGANQAASAIADS